MLGYRTAMTIMPLFNLRMLRRALDTNLKSVGLIKKEMDTEDES